MHLANIALQRTVSRVTAGVGMTCEHWHVARR